VASARLLSVALGLIAAVALLVWFFARPQPEREPASPDRSPPGEGTALAVPQDAGAPPQPGEDADTDEPSTEEPPPDEPRREARTARASAEVPQGIRGRLLGPGDQPLAGARVLAAPSDPRWPWPLDARRHPASARRPPAETRSNADGRFVLLGLEPGPLRVALRRAGSADLDLDELWLQARTVLDLGDLRLEPGLQLEGRIAGLDAGELGLPVEIVRLAGWLPRPAEELNAFCGSPLARSDEEGRFSADRLGRGAVTLLFSHPARPEVVWSGWMAPEQPRDEVVIRFDEASTIAGRVRLAEEADAPLWVRAVPVRAMLYAQDPRVQLDDELELCAGYRESPVDDEGRFELRGIAPYRRWYLRLLRTDQLLESPDAFAPWTVTNPGAEDVELAHAPGGTIELAVSDRASGAPLEELDVRLEGADPARPREADGSPRHRDGGRVLWAGIRPQWSRADGPRFLLDALVSPARERPPIALEVSARGYELRRLEPIDLASGELLRLGWIGLEAAPQLRVRTLDATDGAPIAGAQVVLNAAGPLVIGRRSSVTVSDAAGFARLDPVGSAASELIASAPGYAPLLERDLRLRGAAHDAEAALELRLAPPARVELRVVPEASRSVEVLHAWRDANTLPPYSGWTAPEGTVSFADLGAGAHGFAARALPRLGAADVLAAPLQWTEAVLRHGQSLFLELAVARLVNVDGVLTWGGVPVEGAHLQLQWGAGRSAELDEDWTNGELPARARTDREGRFRFERILPSVYSLIARLPADELTTRFDVAIGTSPRTLEIDLAMASLSGAVLGFDQEPLSGIEIELLPRLRSLEEAGFGRGFLISDLFRYGKPLQRTRSAANGTFAFSAVPLGIDVVLSPRFGAPAAALPLAHPGGGQIHVGDLQLGQSGSIELDARVRGRLPPGRTLVAVASALEIPRPVGIAAAGPISRSASVTLDELIPGRWRVCLCSTLESEYVLEVGPWTEVEVAAGKSAFVDLRWPAERERER
jgi:hypothetical protein